MDNRRQSDQQLLNHQICEERRLLEIETNIKTLDEKIDVLTANVEGLVSAWKAASWLVSTVKWISATAIAIAALYTLFKGKQNDNQNHYGANHA